MCSQMDEFSSAMDYDCLSNEYGIYFDPLTSLSPLCDGGSVGTSVGSSCSSSSSSLEDDDVVIKLEPSIPTVSNKGWVSSAYMSEYENIHHMQHINIAEVQSSMKVQTLPNGVHRSTATRGAAAPYQITFALCHGV